MATKLLEVLDRMRKERERSGAELSRALGHSRCWWRDRLDAGSLGEADARAVANVLGLDYPLLVRTVYGPPGLHQPSTPTPIVVRRAFSRIAEEPIGRKTQLSARLIELAQIDPAAALDQAAQAIETEPPAELAALLSVAGHAASRLMRAEAYAILFGAVEAAQRLEQNTGDALHHVSAHFGLIGEYAIALHCCDLAHHAHTFAGESVGGAKVNAHRCLWNYHLGDHVTAQRWATLALEQLPEDLAHYQIAVRQAEALIALAARDEHRASRLFGTVLSFAERLDGVHDAKALWLGGAIAATFERHTEAAALLAQAVDGLLSSRVPGDLGDAALAACDLVEVQLLQGSTTAAAQTAGKLIPLLESLRHHRQVVEAIRILLAVRHAGLEIEQIGRARKDLQRARPHLANFSRPE